MARNIKLTISYDGARYHGWQSQKHQSGTIQQKMEDMISKYIGENVELNASGRTDAGVHAVGQVANFHTKSSVHLEQLQEAFFTYLPQDIAVSKVEEAPERFHARLSATGKWYRYRIWNSPLLDVFQRNYVWHIKEKLDVAAMKKAARYLQGTHDFISFCSNKRMKKSSVRTIFDIHIQTKEVLYGEEIIIDFKGNGFLYNMVRILTGTMVEVAKGKRNPEEMPAILSACNRQAAGMTAPPMGLSLMEVYYDN